MALKKVAVVLAFLLFCSCGVDWFPDDTKTFTNNSSASSVTDPFTNNSTVFSNTSTASTVPVYDSTGTLKVLAFGAKENSRTTTNVDFSVYAQVSNSGSSTAIADIKYSAVDKDGTEVYGGTTSRSIAAKATQPWISNMGASLTIAQWSSIAKWKIISVTKR